MLPARVAPGRPDAGEVHRSIKRLAIENCTGRRPRAEMQNDKARFGNGLRICSAVIADYLGFTLSTYLGAKRCIGYTSQAICEKGGMTTEGDRTADPVEAILYVLRHFLLVVS
jgi:hypothetical protein